MKLLRLSCLAMCACLAATASAAQGVTLPAVRHVELENGATIILLEKHDVPLIGLQAVLRGGAVSDPAGQAGLSSLLAGLLEKGAGERDAAGFAEAIDSVGASLSASTWLTVGHSSESGYSVADRFIVPTTPARSTWSGHWSNVSTWCTDP